jgi:septum formation protein
MTRVVLGSASTGRLSVLRNAGVDPLVVVSGIDEDAVIAAHAKSAPAEIVSAVANAKADHVVGRLEPQIAADCVVIGCDSMLLLDGRLCGKPGTAEAARTQWHRMAGKSGELLTGHCALRLQNGAVNGRQSETAITTVHFGVPIDSDLDAYIDSGEPLAVAGGFTLDGLGSWFVAGIEGDPSNVIGLSLPLLRGLLQRMDISVAELWSANRIDS